MSPEVEIAHDFSCPHCSETVRGVNLRRILVVGEKTQDREDTLADKVNRVTCWSCKQTFVAPIPLLYRDIRHSFQVCFWPDGAEPDLTVNKDWLMFSDFRRNYKVEEWSTLKWLIQKLEKGESAWEYRVGGGCLGVIAVIAVGAVFIILKALA